jgi:hypothetical protein
VPGPAIPRRPRAQNGARPPDAVPLPRTLAADVDEPMIGRGREVGLLREATSTKIRRRAVLVLGEKTRHATAAAVWDLIGEPLRVGGNSWLSELARARRAGGSLPYLKTSSTSSRSR